MPIVRIVTVLNCCIYKEYFFAVSLANPIAMKKLLATSFYTEKHVGKQLMPEPIFPMIFFRETSYETCFKKRKCKNTPTFSTPHITKVVIFGLQNLLKTYLHNPLIDIHFLSIGPTPFFQRCTT
jgi:hypothetical protein